MNAGEHIGPEPLPPGESRTAPPRLDESTLFFLNIATIALVAGSIALIGIIPVLAPEQTLRVLTPGAIILVVGGARYLLFRGRTKAAVAVLALGTWLVATAGAAFMGGVRSTIIVAYPLIIIFTGWMMGARAAVVMTALSIAAFFGFALAEWTAIAPPWPPTPLAMYWLIQAVVLSLSAATIVYLRRSHHRQVEEVRALTAELTRQRAEAAAAETFRRNQDLLDRTGRLAHVGGWEVDVATRALNWTTETFRIHDLLPGSMPSVDQALAYYPPESRRVLEAAVEKALAEGTGYDLELPLETASGRHIWVRALCEPQFEAGKVVRLSGALQDISAQRAAAQALKESLNNLQRTLQATDEGIFGYDGHDPGGKLLFANDRFFEIWNIPPEARASTGRDEIIAAARKLFVDPDAGVKRIGEILAMGVVHEDKVLLNDGRVLFRRSIPLLAGSQVSRVWSFRDITTEERAKAELIASRDEARRANAAKSEFLSRMSHELRTPMHAIMGMLGLARRRMQDPLGLSQLDKSKAAADHLLSVINDILDISKIEAGYLELEQIDFRLDDVLRNLLNLVGNRAAEKGLKLMIDQDVQGVGPLLRGDPLRLGQILLNLVGNAIKFSDQGDIVVRIRRDEAATDGVRLRFEIEDQGIGIDAEKQERLFRAFEQADGSMTRKYGGTGLGLAISKRLVRKMGGEIGVDSKPGQGSRFWFVACFGAAAPAEAESTTPWETAEQRIGREFAGASVLLVDDEPMGREVTQELLLGAGLVVMLADDGAEALRLARAHRYDLILMDMRMPNLNGVDATRSIRSSSLNGTTPIIAMTANAFEEDRQICLAAGMNDHITKPVDAELLFLRLLHWLTQQRSKG